MSSRQLPLFPHGTDHALTRRSTLTDAIPPFLEHLRLEGRSPHTMSAFHSDLRLAHEFFGDNTEIGTITTTKLNRFMQWIETGRGIPCSRKTYARRVTTLKVFFKFLRNEDILPDNPAEALLQRSGAAPLQPILSDEAIARLLAQTATIRLAEKPDARPEMLLRLLLDTGIKKGECMTLRPEHIMRQDPENPTLIVRHKKPNDTYKERKIPLDPDWLHVLDDYLEQYSPPDTIFDCTARNLEYVLSDVATAAGIEDRVSFEILRWTSAVRDYRRGIDLEKLREKMGLSRISWRETSNKIVQLAAIQMQGELRDNNP